MTSQTAFARTVTRLGRLALWLALPLGVLLQARPTWAQGCVLCYTSVSATGSTAMRGFEWGIIALLTPALILFSAVFLLIFRRARAAHRSESTLPAGNRPRAALRRLPLRRIFAPGYVRQ